MHAYRESKHRPAQRFAASAFAAKVLPQGHGHGAGRAATVLRASRSKSTTPRSKPTLVVHGKVREFCEAHGIVAMEVSLTHIRKDVASAVVVLEDGKPPTPATERNRP
ncbi:MAG: hypothetical protein MZW92_60490 [Comamonadaceae bacterium]|nr:hypothetical protein [Comamonadaceae bacterium]